MMDRTFGIWWRVKRMRLPSMDSATLLIVGTKIKPVKNSDMLKRVGVYNGHAWALSSEGERLSDAEEVGGSSPPAPTTQSPRLMRIF